MTDGAALPAVLEKLVPEDFYLEAHRVLFARMRTLHDAGRGVDVLTLKDALADAGELQEAGGPALLAQLEIEGAIAHHVPEYVGIILQAAGKRRARQSLMAALERIANGSSVMDITQEITEQLSAITERAEPDAARESRDPKAQHIGEVLTDLLAALATSEPAFVRTHIGMLNNRLAGGFLPGDFVLLGAGPGAGKTAFALELAHYAAQDGAPVLIISAEMNNVALGRRVLSQNAQVAARAFRNGILRPDEWQRINRILPQLVALPIHMDDASVTMSQITRSVKQHAGTRLLIVDYIQLLSGPKGLDRRLEVSYLSRSLKRLAKRHNLVVLALSSITPPVQEKGKPQRPTMRNLKESRDLDHDADTVLLLWRPSIDSTDRELIIDKGRDHETGIVKLSFAAAFLRFQELANQEDA